MSSHPGSHPNGLFKCLLRSPLLDQGASTTQILLQNLPSTRPSHSCPHKPKIPFQPLLSNRLQSPLPKPPYKASFPDGLLTPLSDTLFWTKRLNHVYVPSKTSSLIFPLNQPTAFLISTSRARILLRNILFNSL